MKPHIPSTKAFLIVVVVAYLVLAVAALITKASEVLTEDTVQMRFTSPDLLLPNCDVGRAAEDRVFVGFEVTPNNLDVYYFDTNNDTRADYQIMVPSRDINRYPLFYVEAMYDKSGGILSFVDTVRNGTCDGIRVYQWNTPGPPIIDQHGQRDRREPA